MEDKQGFLGTIGYIKANLMTSSALAEKDYNNENFYPGSPDVPISDTSKPSFKFNAVGNVKIDDKYNATSFSSSNYITLRDTPLVSSSLDMRICFTMPSTKLPANNTFIPILCGVSYDNNCYAVFITSTSNMYYINVTCGKWTSATVMDSSSCTDAYFGKNFSLDKKYNLDIKRIVNGSAISHNIKLVEVDTSKVTDSCTTSVSSSSINYYKGPIQLTGTMLGKDYNKNRGSASFSNGIIHLKECYFNLV